MGVNVDTEKIVRMAMERGVSRRQFFNMLAGAGMAVVAAGALTGCDDGSGDAAAVDYNEMPLEDLIAQAQEEGEIQSVGMPDTWANWVETWEDIEAEYGIAHLKGGNGREPHFVAPTLQKRTHAISFDHDFYSVSFAHQFLYLSENNFVGYHYAGCIFCSGCRRSRSGKPSYGGESFPYNSEKFFPDTFFHAEVTV